MTRTFPGGFQTTMVEYVVNQTLDGVTPAPPLGPLLENKPLPAQPYRFEVDNLGLIDLSFDLPDEAKLDPVTTGWRYIPWMHISGGNFLAIGSAVDIGYFRTPGDVGSFRLFNDLDSLESQLVYSRKGYCIPQGMTLRLNGRGALVDGSPIRVRFGVLIPRSEEEEQAIREAFCCTASIPTIGDGATPEACPECGCPFTGLDVTDDEGTPIFPPVLVPVDGVSEWLRLSGETVGDFTLLDASGEGIGDAFIADAEFLEDTCEWRFRLGASPDATPGDDVLLSLFNPCDDTCTALLLGFGQIVAS